MNLQEIMDRFHGISRIDHDRWWVWPAGGIGFDTIKGFLADVDGSAVANAINAGWVGFIAGCFGLWRLWFTISNRNAEDSARSRNRIAADLEIERIRVDEERRASYNRIPDVTVVHPAIPEPFTPPVIPDKGHQP